MSKLIKNKEAFTPITGEDIESLPLDPRVFGKVAVLMGGRSAEREVSLESGRNVLNALLSKGIDAHAIDPDQSLASRLTEGNFARAFIALHGKEGEDGVIQGLLHMLEIPYTGSKVAASALAMDKARAKLVFDGLGISTPIFGVARTLEEAEELAQQIGFPVSVKPSCEGSSIGVTRLASIEDLPQAFAMAKAYGDVIIEKWIDGKDFFVSIVGNDVFPSVEVHNPEGFYDYQAKYQSDKTQYFCPAPLTEAKERGLRDLSYRAFCALGCEGWGRVDLMQDESGKFWVLEVNTIPGMTSHSLVPMSAKAAGIDFENLVILILSTTLEKAEMQKLVRKVAC